MYPTKAPGSDGLPAVFYQKLWGSIGLSVTSACLSVLNDSALIGGMNNTVISLIPKIQTLERVSDFRPISLCNVIYKIIAKAITNRLRKAMGGVISENQCAFIPGRLISDNTIVDFECLHRLKRMRRKNGSMEIKLDVSKAYDRVEWVFLEGMMHKLGFSKKWTSLILRCVESVTYSFLINGEMCGNIKSSRGLKQGALFRHSFSFFLFCTEGLTSLIQGAQKRGTVTGFKCSRGGPVVTHHFFADDSLLFTKANEANCVALKSLLDDYARASDQVINSDK
ncbi:hypothetical protein Dsin_028987 [Dipteronia sinensis]|uniref:Reverse transcriptase domain-containing protein n=1 Tax=Dipteronia sinensis TaxID=43782 RepID=A0AAD9ZT96_9ROSI|nr:hypothetical protein Dsin_028987 [Dipteronia sinensis]